jgi:hypothetical protein
VILLRLVAAFAKRRREILNQREDRLIGGYTPLHHATLSGDSDTVRLLLDAGADPDVRDCNSGFAPLHLATRGSLLDVARTLVCRGGADVNVRDDFGYNAAFWLRELQQAGEEREFSFLGPARGATIEERFFAAVNARSAKGLPIASLPAAPHRDVASYMSRLGLVTKAGKSRGGKGKGSKGKGKKGKKGK